EKRKALMPASTSYKPSLLEVKINNMRLKQKKRALEALLECKNALKPSNECPVSPSQIPA
ncbi:MAG: hypothetical protein KAG26_06955, partial [Methylococcales bacterium]|nr:hypothetical protein [Methylococcales bacterium]